jgi:WD40 repeat protein
MGIQGEQCVIGGADHGLKIISTKTGKLIRELYNKKYGHTEWVTNVDFLTDGRIISGGIDAKLCLWESKAVRCVDLLGHRYENMYLHVRIN